MQKKRLFSLLVALLLLNISLQADEALQEIVITSSNKVTQSTQNSTSSITVISSQEIEEQGYFSVAEALSHQSGMGFTSNGGAGTVTSLFLRGMKTEKILVLLDGVSLNNPSSTDGQAFFEHIPMDTIEQIEIIKGGNSAIWGSDASAGVINIITKKATQGFNTNFNLSYGSFNTKKASTSLGYKKNDFDVILTGSTLKTDGFSATLPENAEKDGYKNNALNLKIGYSFLTHHRLSLNTNYIDANSQYDGAFSDLKADDTIANIDTKQHDFSFNYQYHLDNYTSRLTLIHSDSKRVDFSNSSFGDAKSKYDATQQEIRWIQDYKANHTHFIVGVEAKKIEGRYQFNENNATKNDFNDKALFLSLNHHFNDFTGGKNLIEGAIRQDYFSQFNTKTSFKIGGKHFYTRIQGLQTSFNYYRSIDSPNSYQFANTLINTTLKPDTTKGFDVGIRYKEISLTYFSNSIHQKLGYFSDNVNFLYGYVNESGVENNRGIEADFNYTLLESLRVSTNYTHLFRSRNSTQNPLEKRAKDTLNSNLDYYYQSLFQVGVNSQYIGERVEFGNHTGNYTLWNLHATLSLIKKLKLSLVAKNIFNKKYETTFGYTTPKRSFYGQLNYTF